MRSKEQQLFVARLERRVLHGDPIDFTLEPLERTLLEESPVLLHAYGVHLAEAGDLLQAKEVMLQALKGYAELTLQRLMLDAMARLASVNLQLGQLDEARELLKFLQAVWNRQDEEISGEIPHALGRGASLLGDSSAAGPQYDAAIALYEQAGEVSRACQAWFDKLTREGPGLTDRRWGTMYEAFRQFVQLHQAPYAELAMARAHRDAGEGNLAGLKDSLEQTNGLKLSAVHRKWKRLWTIRLVMELGNQDRVPSMLAEEEGSCCRESDLELRTEWHLLQGRWHEREGDWEAAEHNLAAVEELSRRVIHPALQQRLQALGQRMRKERSLQAAVPDAPGAWHVYLFGGLRFERAGREQREISWKRRRTKELFLYLLLQPRFAAHREQVAEELFADAAADKIANQLSVAAHQLKQVLKQALGIDQGIFMKNGILQLKEEYFDYVDVEQYTALIRVGSRLWPSDPEMASEMLEKAVALYDPLAPGMLYLDWLDRIRRHLLEQQTAALNRLGRHEQELGLAGQAESRFLEWIALCPSDEEAYQLLIRLLMEQGRQGEAEKWYRKLERLCKEEMGTEPLPETKKLLERNRS